MSSRIRTRSIIYSLGKVTSLLALLSSPDLSNRSYIPLGRDISNTYALTYEIQCISLIHIHTLGNYATKGPHCTD